MLKTILLSLCLLAMCAAQAQTKKALFLGNSYTGYNSLANLTSSVAESMGDSLIVDSNTPGGYTLEGHSTNNTSLTKIMQGDWDFVVLQEQSQLPSFPDSQVESSVYPYAELLDNTINEYNGCAETIFYMTWGRENGDASNCASWPPVCTYEGMDSLLALRYGNMAEANEAILSPVGRVWRYIRENHPTVQLYTSDSSHPSVVGSYAAAVCFYTVMYREDPNLIPFNHSLDEATANLVRAAVAAVVYEDIAEWHVGEYDLTADFSYAPVDGYTYSFTGNSTDPLSALSWSMNGSTESVTEYEFPGAGDYEITLTASNSCDSTEYTQVLSIDNIPNGLSEYRQTLRLSLTDEHQLILPASADGVALRIYDMQGRMVMDIDIKHSRTVQLSAITSGMYLLSGTNSKRQQLTGQFHKP